MTDPGPIVFEVLGPLRARRGDQVVTFGADRPSHVLAVLLAVPERAATTGRIGDEVWPAASDERRRNLVQNAVWQLNRRLRPLAGEAVVTYQRPDRYLLDATVVVDSVEVSRLAATATGRDDLVRLLDRWRGPRAFDGVYDVSTVDAEVERLSVLRTSLLERRIDTDLEAGRHLDVIAELHALTAEQPFHEGFALRLMTALYRSGRAADALSVFEHTRRTLLDELGLDVGPPLWRLQGAVLRHEVPPAEFGPAEAAPAQTDAPAPAAGTEPAGGFRPASVRPVPVPPMTGTTIGRDALVDAVERALDTPGPLTLAGLGGVGKTRVALEVATAAARRDRWVCVVDVSALGRGDLLAGQALTAAGLLDVDGTAAPPIDRLVALFAGRRGLVVLDGAEHHLDAVAPFVDGLGRRCPDLSLLCTSRQPLGVAGERLVLVRPLDVEASVAMLVDRAGGSLGDGDATELAGHLGGLPLGIELVAGLLRVLPVGDVLDAVRPSDSDDACNDGSLIGIDRRIRAALDWTWDHLSPDERRLWCRLGVLAGPCTVGTVTALGRGGIAPPLELLATLAERGLVVVEQHDGRGRYRLGDIVRDYARGRLSLVDEPDAVLDLLRRHYVVLADREQHRIVGPEQLDARRVLDVEYPNLRWVLASSLGRADGDTTALQLCWALGEYWFVAGQWAEGASWCREALRRTTGPYTVHHALATAALSRAAGTFAGSAAGEELYEEALAWSRAHGEVFAELLASVNLAVARLWRRDLSGFALLEAADRLVDEADDGRVRPALCRLRAAVAALAGNRAEMRRLYDEAKRRYLAQGNRIQAANAVFNLAVALQHYGNPADAVAALDECEQLAAGLALPALEVHAASTRAMLSLDDDPAGAEQQLAAAAADFELLSDVGCLNGCLRAQAELRRRAGDDEGALGLVRSNLARVEHHDDREFALSLLTIAEVYADRRRTADAELLLRATIDRRDRRGVGLNATERARFEALQDRLRWAGGPDSKADVGTVDIAAVLAVAVA